MYYIIGVLVLIIGVCGLIAGYIIDDDMYIVLFVWGWIGIILGMLIIVIALSDKSNNENKTINENNISEKNHMGKGIIKSTNLL